MTFAARIWLADHGWSTDDRFSNLGWGDGFGYSIWAKRYDWHGVRLGSAVCFHRHLSPAAVSDSAVEHAWQDVLHMCQYAWDDYPDAIPKMGAGGRISKDESLTEIVCNVHGGNPWHRLNKQLNTPATEESEGVQ